jgi:hypothetical protein
VASLEVAKEEVKLLNERVQKKESPHNPDQTDTTSAVKGQNS